MKIFLSKRQQSHSTKDNPAGSVLMEAILSVAILSVSLTLILQSLTTAMRSTVYCLQFTQAIFLAEDKMFEILRKRFIKTNLSEEGSFPDPYDNYQYHLETNKAHLEDWADEINQIDLHLSWTSGKRKNTLPVVTYLFNLTDENR